MASIAFFRLLVIRATGGVSAKYEPGETRCPFCDLVKLDAYKGSVKVVGTEGIIRRCKCLVCGTSFKAIGNMADEEKSGETPDLATDVTEVSYKESKKTKKGRKNGNSSRTRSRSRTV